MVLTGGSHAHTIYHAQGRADEVAQESRSWWYFLPSHHYHDSRNSSHGTCCFKKDEAA